MAEFLTTRRVIDLCGAVSAVAWISLAMLSQEPPVELTALFTVLGVTWCALAFALTRCPETPGPGFVRRIAVWAILFRAVGLFAEPILEDDHYRYLWDGRTFAVSGNPYRTTPSEHFSDPSVPAPFQIILDRINHPDLPTLYGPLSEWIFLASYHVAPGELWPLKLALLAADLATLYLLTALVPLRGLLLYAWCPLLIQETAFTAHIDSAGVLFLVWALAAYTRGRDRWLGFAAALAVAVKWTALPALLLLAPRTWQRSAPIFAGLLSILYLPFVFADLSVEPTAYFGLAGLAVFAREWEFNSTAYAILASSLGVPAARAAAVLASAGVCLWLIRTDWGKESRTIPRGDLLMAAVFLFSPVVNPWYLLWMLPFVCAYPSAWGVAAMAAVSLTYAHGLFLPDSGLPAYHHPGWVRPLEVTIVALGVGASRWTGRKRSQPKLNTQRS